MDSKDVDPEVQSLIAATLAGVGSAVKPDPNMSLVVYHEIEAGLTVSIQRLLAQLAFARAVSDAAMERRVETGIQTDCERLVVARRMIRECEQLCQEREQAI